MIFCIPTLLKTIIWTFAKGETISGPLQLVIEHPCSAVYPYTPLDWYVPLILQFLALFHFSSTIDSHLITSFTYPLFFYSSTSSFFICLFSLLYPALPIFTLFLQSPLISLSYSPPPLLHSLHLFFVPSRIQLISPPLLTFITSFFSSLLSPFLLSILLPFLTFLLCSPSSLPSVHCPKPACISLPSPLKESFISIGLSRPQKSGPGGPGQVASGFKAVWLCAAQGKILLKHIHPFI